MCFATYTYDETRTSFYPSLYSTYIQTGSEEQGNNRLLPGKLIEKGP
jgi:hypothetical protein